jgi:hypothetical protein
MGMIDQRGEWRRVVTDGQRQAPATAQGQAEDVHPVEAWGTPSAPASTSTGEQRAIRLLPDSDAVRAPGRAGGMPARNPEADMPMGENQGRVERTRRLRGDEAHATSPTIAAGRAPGPLSARMALRQRRDLPETIAIAPTTSIPRAGLPEENPLS